jgi:hypothetical protein
VPINGWRSMLVRFQRIPRAFEGDPQPETLAEALTHAAASLSREQIQLVAAVALATTFG